MAEQTVRPGEVLVVNDTDERRLYGSSVDTDGHGRHTLIGFLPGVSTIVGKREAEELARVYPVLRIVKGDVGHFPERIRAENSAGQDAFVGRVREVSPSGKVNALMDEGLRPMSLAGAAMQLIVAGVFSRDEAIVWAKEQLQIAIATGGALREPWVAEAATLIKKKGE